MKQGGVRLLSSPRLGLKEDDEIDVYFVVFPTTSSVSHQDTPAPAGRERRDSERQRRRVKDSCEVGSGVDAILGLEGKRNQMKGSRSGDMSVHRGQGGPSSMGLAIRVLPSSSSSLSRCAAHHSSSSSSSEHARTPAWMGKGLSCVCIKRKGTYERICMSLTPLQEQRVQRLRHRMEVYFDSSRPDHQEALRALWSATYPGQELECMVSEQWKQMGWQGRDPSTDFRGAGFISLENLLFFAKTFSISFQQLLNKTGGKRATWEYPFAVAGVNITFMIMQMLDLHSLKPRTFVRTVFIQMLSESEWAFDLLYCVAFMVMDKLWLARNASYMDFNDILKSTRAQLEQELLMDDVLRIEDMPSYSLLS